MINFLDKLFLFLFKRNNKAKNNTISHKKNNEVKISKQKLYEKWCKKEKWLLYDEGILLLLSINPSKKNIQDKELIRRIDELKAHAKECVKKNLLSVVDVDKPENNWEVKPIDLYRWATISRIDIPDEFNALMIFITQTIKGNSQYSSDINFKNSTEKINQLENEIILGAAMSLLMNSSEICRDNEGNIDAKVIVSKIIENKKHWFGDTRLEISEPSMINLIEKYARISKVLY